MKQLIFIFLLILSCQLDIHGQERAMGSWQIGYFGNNVIHPGFKVSKEYVLKTWEKTKDKVKGDKTSHRAYAFSPEFVFYRHKHNHYGLVLNPSVNYQRTRTTGGYVELRIGTGYHRSFLDGTTYRVNSNGEVETVPLPGQNTWISSITWSFGKDLRKTKELPIRYYMQLGASARTPYNHHFLPSVNVGFGMHYFIRLKERKNE